MSKFVLPLLFVLLFSVTSVSAQPATLHQEYSRVMALRVTPVGIEIFTGRAAAGTAFFVAPRLAVTAYHVVDDWAIWRIESRGLDGVKRMWKVLAVDRKADMAILGLVDGPPGTGPWPTARTIPQLGDEVCTVTAYPHFRRVCGPVQPSPYQGQVVFGGIVTPGNSGSPLFYKGYVVGVTVALVECGKTPCLGVASLF